MPRIRQSTGFGIDNSLFSERINEFTRGRVTVDDPTINDYLQHYGSKKDLISHYQDVTGLKWDSARKQVERMMQKPNMKLKHETVERLGKLSVNEEDVVITITGWYSYMGNPHKFEYNTFSNSNRPFTASEMRSIIKATRQDGNTAGINRFMELYGVGGSFGIVFASQDLHIDIHRV